MRMIVSLGFAILLAVAAPARGADPEYDGHCALGMSQGTPISTDCAVVWLSPQSGRQGKIPAGAARESDARAGILGQAGGT